MHPPIVTRTSKYWIEDDGIVRGTHFAGQPYGHQDAVETEQVLREIAKGERRCLMMDISAVTTISREARAHFGGPQFAELLIAVALVVQSQVSRAIGNFIIGWSRPPIPTRLFTSPELAIAWLSSLGGKPTE